MIVDAGGGTIDISTYEVIDNWPLEVEELYESKCELGQQSWQNFHWTAFVPGLVQGGELVTVRATEMVRSAS